MTGRASAEHCRETDELIRSDRHLPRLSRSWIPNPGIGGGPDHRRRLRITAIAPARVADSADYAQAVEPALIATGPRLNDQPRQARTQAITPAATPTNDTQPGTGG